MNSLQPTLSSSTTLNRPVSPMRPFSPYQYKDQVEEQVVDVFIQCKDLPKLDVFSKTDPFCVLFIKRYGQWYEFCRTEIIFNCHEPKFVETFQIDINKPGNELVKLAVYNSQNMNVNDLSKSQYMASVTITLEITNKFKEYELKDENKSKSKLLLYVRPHIFSKKKIELNFGALKLTKKGLFNRIDSFFEIETELYQDTFHPVYRSEVIYKNCNPRWFMLSLYVNKLCKNEMDLIFYVTIMNMSAKGDHELIGRTPITLKKLLEIQGTIRQLPVTRINLPTPQNSTVSTKTKNNGFLTIYFIGLNEYFALQDFIRAGVNINCSIAVDFTLSNGHPLDPTSLHAVTDGRTNYYIEALQHVGGWLMHHSKVVKLYGFGGEIKSKKQKLTQWKEFEDNLIQNLIDGLENEPETKEEYCFEIYKNENDLNNNQDKTSEVLVDKYIEVLPYIHANGPTYFLPLVEKAFVLSENIQDFNILLIISDGICSDFDEIEDYFVNLKKLSLIVIIIGIGPCNFQPIKRFIDKLNKLLNHPIFNFLNISKYSSTVIDLNSFYAKLSKDLVTYFKSINIKPDLLGGTMVMDENDKENFSMNYNKLACPTCGSHVNLY